MGYGLGIDVGTTFTAAALYRNDTVEIFPLATYQVAVPSVIFAAAEEMLFGGPADRRGAAQPLGLAREFKRRLGDPVPLMLSGSPYHADRLTALMAKWVLDTVTAQVGSAPTQIVMTHPANWTEYQLGTLRNALVDVGLADTVLISEPAAAALDFSAAANVEAGATVLVYDLGGGTFDVALLRHEGDTFEHQIEPAGIERLGGIDFDEAVFQYVRATVPPDVLETARHNPEGAAAIAQLRRRCVDAKEALSSDATSDVPVMLPEYTSTVRITRPEFEDMIRPMVRQTIEVVQNLLERAHMEPSSLGAVLLVGGSSRIPLVPQMVAEHLHLPVRIDAHPKLVVAKGAARRAGMATPASRSGRPASVDAGRDDDEGGGGLLPKLAVAAVALVVVVAGIYWFLLRDDSEGTAGPDQSTVPVTAPASEPVVVPPTAASTASSTSGADSTAPGSTQSAPPSTVPPTPPGDVLWTVPTGAPMASVKGPALAEDTVIFGSQNGSIYRVDAEDGSPVWQQPVGELVFSSPLVAGDAVFVGSDDGVHSLTLADGSSRWVAAQGAAARSSPTVVDGTVYIGSDDTNLYALDAATGAVRWQTPLGGQVLSSPAVNAGLVYVGSFDGAVYAVDAATGEIRWRTPTEGQVWSSPFADGSTVYVGSNDGHLYALDAASGAVIWRFVTSDTISSSPTAQDGIVYIGGFDGMVYAIDARVGGERWRFDTENVVFSSPRVVDGTVYVGSHSASLYALAADDGSLRWSVEAGAIIGTTPAVDASRVYFGSDDGNLYAVQR